jgi:hypothetical protein
VAARFDDAREAPEAVALAVPAAERLLAAVDDVVAVAVLVPVAESTPDTTAEPAAVAVL